MYLSNSDIHGLLSTIFFSFSHSMGECSRQKCGPQGLNVSLKEAISEKISSQPHPIALILPVPIYTLGSGEALQD